MTANQTRPHERMSPTAPVEIDVVVGNYMDPHASGVARFNQILAERLAVPFISLLDPAVAEYRFPFLSFKVAELDHRELQVLDEILRRGEGIQSLRVYLHEFSALPLEEQLARQADVLYCGNAEVAARTAPLNPRACAVWAPGNMLDQRFFADAPNTVFSFGMAHKMQTRLFARLRELLAAADEPYAVYMSNAHHDAATLEEAQVVFEEMRRIFPQHLYFLGNLSEVAIHNFLHATRFFAAFFKSGVRANNGSVGAAMEQGCVVITNLDEYSPDYFVHMHNVIDINRCEELPSDPLELERIGAAAMETARSRSWDHLLSAIRYRGHDQIEAARDPHGDR
jgi:hypothetical protein